MQSYKVKKLCKKRLTFFLLCFKIENVKRARERFTQDKKIFSSFLKKRLDKQYRLWYNKENGGEKMKFTFVNLAKANIQDVCLQWENRNVIDVAWFEDFAIIISK